MGRFMTQPLRASLLAMCLAICMSIPSFAQVSGTFSGTVTDQSGAVLPGVEVTATNTGTALTRTVITNERGDYVISVLPIGEYEVQASLPGFQTAVRPGITLQVDDRISVNFELSVGVLTESVIVTEAAPLVQSETSSIGGVIANQQVVELPLNGRAFQNLTLLVPGAMNPTQGSSLGFRGGVTVAGSQENMTSFSLDGVDMVNGLMRMISFKPSIDMIQEFKVQTSTYSSEFGRTGGRQVQVTTKSGSNRFHGTGYVFLRDEALDAKNVFDPADAEKPPLSRENFGFTIGGPIVNDRTFFFVSYEGLRLDQSQTRTASVPTAAMKRGDFSALSKPVIDPQTGHPFSGNIIPSKSSQTSIRIPT